MVRFVRGNAVSTKRSGTTVTMIKLSPAAARTTVHDVMDKYITVTAKVIRAFRALVSAER